MILSLSPILHEHMELDGSRIYVTDFSQLFLEASLARNIIQVQLTEQLLYLQAGSIILEPVQTQHGQYWIWATGPS